MPTPHPTPHWGPQGARAQGGASGPGRRTLVHLALTCAPSPALPSPHQPKPPVSFRVIRGTYIITVIIITAQHSTHCRSHSHSGGFVDYQALSLTLCHRASFPRVCLVFTPPIWGALQNLLPPLQLSGPGVLCVHLEAQTSLPVRPQSPAVPLGANAWPPRGGRL